MFKRRVLASSLFATLFCFGPIVSADVDGISGDGTRYGGADEVILQGFHWNIVREANGQWYNTLESMSQNIADLGVTSIWMPPMWRDDSSWSSGSSYGGGEGYMWRDFVKDSNYGSDSKLKDAALALTNKNVKVIYDIVANHRDKRLWQDPVTQNSYPAWDPGGDLWAKNCWIPCENWNNPVRDDGDGFIGAEGERFFDLNTAHPTVYADIKNELINLVNNYHASGFRWDFARGFTPFRVNSWLNDVELATGESLFSVGELWKSPISQDQLHDWSDDAKSTIFDFALKEKINSGDIFSWRHGLNGNPRQSWRERAVTFVGNHDTDYSPGNPVDGQSHWPTPAWAIDHAYAYILTTPGTPTVYWPHAFDEPRYAHIQNLISIRKAAGVTASSAIKFENSTGPGIAATVFGNNKKLLLSIGSTWDWSYMNYVQVAQGSWGTVWMEPQDSTTVMGRFFCGNGTTVWGENVYAVGNIPELGSWNTANAVLLDAANYPEWNGWIELPPSTSVEWKCIKKDGNGNVTWQAGANNISTTPAFGGLELDGMF